MVVRGNMMHLTYYEWDERLSYILSMTKVGQMHPMTLLSDLAHLWRHIDGEVYPASILNDLRQDRMIKACKSLNISHNILIKLVKGQRAQEERVVENGI